MGISNVQDVGIRITADGVIETTNGIKLTKQEVFKLGQGLVAASNDAKAFTETQKQSASAADQYVQKLRQEADELGKTRLQIVAMRADQVALTEVQKQSVVQSITRIKAYEDEQAAIKAQQAANDEASTRYVGYAKLSALAAGAVAAAFLYKTGTAINAAAAMATLSEKTGLSVEMLSTLRYAAALTDTSIETLGTGLGRLNQAIFKGEAKGGELGGYFKALEIDPSTLKSGEQALYAIADKFKGIDDHATKATLAAVFFGKGIGEQLLPFLNQGSEGIRRLQEEGRQWTEISAMSAERAKQLKDNIATLNFKVSALSEQFAEKLVPGLNDVTGAMIEAAKESGVLYTAWVGLGGLMDKMTSKSAGQAAAIDIERAKVRKKFFEDQKSAQERIPESMRDPGTYNGILADLKKVNAELESATKKQQDLLNPPAPAAKPKNNDASVAARVEWQRILEQNRSQAERMQQEIAKAREVAKKAGTEDALPGVLAGIRQKYAGKKQDTGAPEWIISLEQELAKVENRATRVDLVIKKLTEGKDAKRLQTTPEGPALSDRALSAARALDAIDVEKTRTKGAIAEEGQLEEMRVANAAAQTERQKRAIAMQKQASSEIRQAEIAAIADPHARAMASLDEERARRKQALDEANLEVRDRQALQEQLDQWYVARAGQLAEDLKPQWQKMLDAWQDNNRLMRDSVNSMHLSVINAGEQIAVQFGRTGRLSGRAMIQAFQDEVSKSVYRKYFAPSIGSLADMGGNLIGRMLGGGSTGGDLGIGVETAGAYSLMHSGGIAGETSASRRVSADVFAGARRYHAGGLAGDEVPAILRKGEEVLTESDPRHRANGGVSLNVVINDQRTYSGSLPVQVTQRRGADGALVAQVLIRDSVRQSMNSGELDATFANNYGLRRPTVQR